MKYIWYTFKFQSWIWVYGGGTLFMMWTITPNFMSWWYRFPTNKILYLTEFQFSPKVGVLLYHETKCPLIDYDDVRYFGIQFSSVYQKNYQKIWGMLKVLPCWFNSRFVWSLLHNIHNTYRLYISISCITMLENWVLKAWCSAGWAWSDWWPTWPPCTPCSPLRWGSTPSTSCSPPSRSTTFCKFRFFLMHTSVY